MNENLATLFREYERLSSDSTAAAILTLAHVHCQSAPEPPSLLDTAEAAKRLGVSKAQVQALCRSGAIRHSRVGRLMKFKPEWIDEFLRPAAPKSRHW